MKIPAVLSLLIACFFAPLSAQPVLTAAQLPQAGDVRVHDWMNSAPAQTPNEGPNVVWDLSQNTFNSLDDSGVYLNLTSTLPGWNYNLAFQYYSGTQPKLDFYELGGTEMRYAGYARTDQSLDTLVLPGSSLLLPVPLSYGGSFAQNLSGYYVNNGSNIPLTGRTFLDADAWGTLILPWASYTDILRVHVRDSLNILGFPQINDSYYYYSASENHPILVIQQKNPPTGYAVRPGMPLAIAEAGPTARIRLFPNPTSGVVYLEMPSIAAGGTSIGLRDIAGRQVWQAELEQDGQRMHRLDFGDLPSGLYFVQIASKKDGLSWQKKLLLE